MSTALALPKRAWTVLLLVSAAGCGVSAAAAVAFATTPRDPETLLGVAALLAAAALAERYPVPLDVGGSDGRLSLSFVFGAAAIVLFGWAAGALVLVAAVAGVHLVEHRPPARTLYNSSVYALGAATAGVAISPLRDPAPAYLLAQVVVAYAVLLCVNLLLIGLILAATHRRPFASVFEDGLRRTAAPFALMSSAALMLVVLWQRSPFFSIALIAPLLAIALYQRSQYRAVRDLQRALTDPLTGLANHTQFHERLQRELLAAHAAGTPLSLCLLDVDDLEAVNERDGHAAGDAVLTQLAARLRQGGEAFRVGGDEFAVLLPGYESPSAGAAARSIVRRVSASPVGQSPITVSAGVATSPSRGLARDELVRLADAALSRAKKQGKNRAHVYRPDDVELPELVRLATGAERAARQLAAADVAKAVDARDAQRGHSGRVGDLAARIGGRLGLDAERVELLRLAGSLHDLGKLAIPEEILGREEPLTGAELLVLQRHPEIGFRMLESLGIPGLPESILHHHERWDGTGYPHGLAGAEIPLGARIIAVAGAYDTITTGRVYRERLSATDALAELRRCAGSQFDPEVVAALEEELGAATRYDEALAS